MKLLKRWVKIHYNQTINMSKTQLADQAARAITYFCENDAGSKLKTPTSLLFAEIIKYAMDNDSKSIEDLNELVDELRSLESSNANNSL